MSRLKCCVPLCHNTSNDVGVILHSFPNPVKDSERFRQWVLKIGGEIVGLDNNTIFNNRRVCHKHFADHFQYLSNRLSKTAVPQLQLPAPHRLQTIIDLEGRTNLSVEQQTIPPLSVEPVPSTSQAAALFQPESDIVKLNVEELTTPYLHVGPSTLQATQNKHTKAVSHKISYQEQGKVRKIINKLKLSLKKRMSIKSVDFAINISKSKAFNMLTTKMSDNAKRLFLMQVTQSGKKMKGRRFTLDEKILALSLYKPSPKSYRILRRMCVLPSRRSLQSLLQSIRLDPGYNQRIFNHLKKRVSKMPEKHKYCILVFDEMAIAPSCTFNAAKDLIEGFVDDGQQRENVFCDHVLVFMIRGVVKKYKQPVWFSYAAGTTKTLSLKNQIKSVIKHLTEAGLFVTATVCDQGTTNIAAINSLIFDTRSELLRKNKEYTGGFFITEKIKIFVLYDPPHLIKGVRNNLLTKNLNYMVNGEERTAKWEHIHLLYDRSPGYKGVKMVPKLTAQHVVPQLIPKMKVKHCTQVFSKSVGAALGYMAESGCLPQEATQTADLLIFFDELFDSVNGNYHEAVGGKIYRTAVTPRSPHHKLWHKSLPVLRSMRFHTPLRGGVVPSLTSWVKTIESFKKISLFLQTKGINSLLLRNFNQDALENFFGSIRAHGHGNIMPSASHFEAAYKTLLLNNLTTHYAVGSNCEADDGFALESFKEFINEQEPSQHYNAPLNIDIDHVLIEGIDTDFLIRDTNRQNVEKCAAVGYCSGWIAVKAKMAVYKNCTTCKNNMETEEMQGFHSYIKVKEFENKRWLCYPTRCLFDFFALVEHICYEVLKTSATRQITSNYLKVVVGVNTNLNFIECAEHKESLKKFLIDKSVSFFVNNWCKEVGHLLTGKADKHDESDVLKNSARTLFVKSRGKKRRRQSGVLLNV